MILIVLALLLFVCYGTTGKLVRAGLLALFCNIVIYFGIPLVAVVILFARA